jgi:hypothetical protein
MAQVFTILDLPVELASTLISDWLTIVDMARLDSAVCNSAVRADFSRTAYNTRTILQYPSVIPAKMKKTIFMNLWVFKKDASIPGSI